VGDLLFAVANLARKLGVEPNAALERANAKFTRRFEQVEALAEERGIQIGRASLAELDKLWEEVKAKGS
jgi:ATP diphosphatase